ncbi:ribosome maturation factor RimM [Desulfosarcina widdelii]|uniref:Ribosome maturation factor RimM n=1 Tax=Desulfosarcina widdelii TaxID=947919 RepID=A0A5K7ZGC5_9BACT|nr:ribosome maturation factor RimM [Desulfosarcina widdelii]BBO78831.1 ribosome maturation factor RimM [Desulfosarcina widdelii]
MKSSNSPGNRDDLILVGKVVGAHGIRGNLKVRSYTESLSVYEAKEGIHAILPDGSIRTMTVDRVWPHGKSLLMNFESVTRRDQAEGLIGTELFVEKDRLPALEEDTYYWFDLVGLRVIDASGTRLGRLVRIIPTSGNDIYVVRGACGGQPQETLIPAIGDVVLSIDLEGGIMTVDLPEGL